MENPITFLMVMVSMFLFYAWVAWIILEWRKLGRRSQLHHKLLDRFQSPGELQAFLQSEGGEHFLKSIKIDGLAPKEKILASFSRVAVATFLGIAFLAVGFINPEHLAIFLSAGIIIVGLGLGLLVSALISLNLSKKWGVFDR
ncbi:MAG: hypothetical protein A2Y86_01835 [Candidatus Aminicenantes bacterium RBG_13_62_12]|nr:MAG: hypothetical protein A2Y86_01835 [Candidatus Aminicenantes bacterium RBG_13_62_12]